MLWFVIANTLYAVLNGLAQYETGLLVVAQNALRLHNLAKRRE